MPTTFDDIADLIGVTDTFKLGGAYGGTRLTIPGFLHPVQPDSPLALVLGLKKAKRLQAVYAGETIYMPLQSKLKGYRDAAICEEYQRMTAKTLNRAQYLARKYQISERRVMQIVESGTR